MFVCLDSNQIFYPENKISKLLKIIPQFQEFRKNLSETYKEFNKNMPYMTNRHSVKCEQSSNNKTLQNKKIMSKNLIYIPNKEEEIKCKKIFKSFRLILEEISSKNLPKEPIFADHEAKVIIMLSISKIENN